MRNIMVAIKPKWCELIFSGEKTCEIRKTLPNEPFKAFVYVTRAKPGWVRMDNVQLSGRVVGEFVCRAFNRFYWREMSPFASDIRKKAVLTISDLRKYAKDDEMLYAWHISDVVLYDQPIDIENFFTNNGNIMKRPPQSWQYVFPRCYEV